MALSHTDVRRILEILDSAEHLESLDVTVGEFVLHASKPGAAALAPARTRESAATHAAVPATQVTGTTDAPAAPPPLENVPAGMVAVRAPMVGTFYLHPSPDRPAFVAVGSTVNIGDTVCLVEVMKMFNSVQAEVAGTVARIVVEDGKPVQHGQIVMLIKPTQEG